MKNLQVINNAELITTPNLLSLYLRRGFSACQPTMEDVVLSAK